MSWELIDRGQINGVPLDLYRTADHFMIRVNGLELMNSNCVHSEQALAQIARAECTLPKPAY